jgi:hypothetical protein
MFGTISFIYLERPIRRFGASIAERLAGRLSTDHPREIGALPQTAPNGAPTASGAIQPLELAKFGADAPIRSLLGRASAVCHSDATCLCLVRSGENTATPSHKSP